MGRTKDPELLDATRALFESQGSMTCIEAFRRLSPACSCQNFRVGYYRPIHREVFGRDYELRHTPRGPNRAEKPASRESLIPLPAPAEIPPPVVRLKPKALVALREQAARRGMHSEAGRFQSEPVEGGRYRITVELAAAERSVALFLTGFLHGILFPEGSE